MAMNPRSMIMGGLKVSGPDFSFRRRPDVDRVILFPRTDPPRPEDREGLAAGSPRVRQAAGDPSPGLRIFEPKSRGPRDADLGRARRLLAAALTYVAHPSFDDPAARDAILAPATGFEGPGPEPTPAGREPDGDASPGNRFPTREREAHAFRKLNYLKCLACRIRDGLDPDSPDPAELDEVERLQAEALKLRNRIVGTHLRLVVSVARKSLRVGDDLSDRVNDGAVGLMQAVARFDFARGNRFSTYATWAILNALAEHDRKQRRLSRTVALYADCLATRESEGERYEREEAEDARRAAVERLLGRLGGRERRILESRHGIGGVPEHTLAQIGRDLGISKERVRQIEQRAHAKLRGLARLEAIGPSSL
jgi:RNA polymerase primary sigma factor